jgi:predicted DNA-binding transcriptional regulator AlpA
MRFFSKQQGRRLAGGFAVWGCMVIEQLLDINDVAKLTKFSVAAIRKYVLLHQIPFHKIYKAIRFRPSEIDEWINKGGGQVLLEPLEGEDLFTAAGVRVAAADGPELEGGEDGQR